MFPVGDVQNPETLAGIFGCGWSYLPTIYLGLPLGASSNSSAIWNNIMLRFQSRLDGWRSKFLSLGGRIILCKSSMSSQPLYQFSLVRAPKTVIHKMEKMQRNFIWSGTQDKSKFHLVRWNICKASKERGGLGVLDLNCMNSALLAKWFWKYAMEPTSWWRQLIKLKFPNPSSTWRAGSSGGPLGCSMWKQIMKEEALFWNFAYVTPGGGAWVSFWKDCWLPGLILKDAYPRVVAASSVPEAWVSELISFENESVGWDLHLSLSLRGGAERERLDLIQKLLLLPPDLISAGPAKLIWKPSMSGDFSVKSMYTVFSHDRLPGIVDFPHKVVWDSFAPTKVKAFLWLLKHGRVLTHENLKKRGLSLASMCIMCKEAEENINHLFWLCPFSNKIWNTIQQMVEIVGPFPAHVDAVIAGWNVGSQLPWKSGFVRGLLHAYTWEIWKERNSRIFQDKSVQWQVIFHKICRSLLNWVLVTGTLNEVHREEWLSLMQYVCPLQSLRIVSQSTVSG
ncbi:unnamed protein product [Linum trigynum]|uniref:Reverse transcriptase zinc-binding domain-containing protein n=1 Tax=Linum trigynum TaxID=586398 RepID=A0AAV2C9H8_9ROSI